jgi:hypothetical protein
MDHGPSRETEHAISNHGSRRIPIESSGLVLFFVCSFHDKCVQMRISRNESCVSVARAVRANDSTEDAA